MANPGPASTVSNSPQILGTNQALRLIASAQSVNLSAAGDIASFVLDVTKFVPTSVVITNGLNSSVATTTIATAIVGGYACRSQTGFTFWTTAALTSNTGGLYASITSATISNPSISNPPNL